MIQRYAAEREDVRIYTVNTTIRYREIYDLRTWKRVLSGGLQCLRDIPRLLLLLLIRRPHVVHHVTSGQLSVLKDIVFMTLTRIVRVPTVYHIRFGRVPEIAESGTREWRWISRAMRMAHTVVAIDRVTEAAIAKHLPDVRLKRIPNCVAPDELPPPVGGCNGERVVLYLGWVIPTKGMDELIEAWARLNPQGWHLRVVGRGDAAYRERLMEQHRPNGVEFTGEMAHDEAMIALAEADVFVLPSYTEGFPNVVLEAMTLGKPIVATSVGAIPEMLADGCGLLIPPRNIDALTDALSRLLRNADLRSCLGSRARERVLEEFAIDTVFGQLMMVWQNAAGMEK